MPTPASSRATTARAPARSRASKPSPAPGGTARKSARAASEPAGSRARSASAKRPAAPVAPPPPAPARPAPSGKAAKGGKSDRKTVRDSFNMPRDDFALLDRLKDVAKQAGRPAKKSELIRAGLHALEALDGAGLAKALQRLPAVAKGRPRGPASA